VLMAPGDFWYPFNSLPQGGTDATVVRTRVKICGITRPEDGLAAAHSGADSIGLVFYPQSPRVVDMERARAVVRELPPFVTVVGLFVDAEPEHVRTVLEAVPVELLQFHGSEPPEYCRAFGRRYIKAVSMRAGVDVTAASRRYRDAAGLLLDAYSTQVPGGSGAVFDWAQVPTELEQPLILAGGLSPENVVQAIRAVRPYAVDVSSGVESAKGVKDEEKIEAFIRGVFSVQFD
jgi:phosphoribosylanthranilate isomerase